MADPLAIYRSKRDFSRTPEPSGDAAQRRRRALRGASPPRFVVQEHAARRRHFDLRLEIDGVLKSWAVPMGPSDDPAVRRLAVQVEDHPLDYAEFEGEIPAGQYGAGRVRIWDRGTWSAVGDPRQTYADGRMRFDLAGERLRGRWMLVRMRAELGGRGPQWLMIRDRRHVGDAADDVAIRDVTRGTTSTLTATPTHRVPVPRTLAPALATLVETPPLDAGWRWELKLDGYRMLARIDGDDVRLSTRNGLDWTARLPRIADAVRGLPFESAWIDGEIVVLGADGATDFGLLQAAFDSRSTDAIRYVVFDLPFADGRDLRAAPLLERRAALRAVLARNAEGPLSFSEDVDGDPPRLLDAACRLGVEGLIGKRADAPYRSGRQTTWIKLKCLRRQEFVIGGYTESRTGPKAIGALLLGVRDGAALCYVGRVGTGFDARTRRCLLDELAAEKVGTPPFADAPRAPDAFWVRPRRVAEVTFAAWTREGRLRHASFRGLRADKSASAIVRERPLRVAGAGAAAFTRVSHPERVVDASSGASKEDIVRYYEDVAATMRPHLHGRPVSLLRAPRGVGAPTFFQKHLNDLRLRGVVGLDPSLDPGHAPLMAIDGAAGLAAAAQVNVLEIHTWNARAAAIERPDRLVFDLDPGVGVGFEAVRDAALLVRTLLEEMKLGALVKTSGGHGLHVVVPIVPGPAWRLARDASRAVAVHLTRCFPDRFTATRGEANREGRVFVDWMRNGRGATTVAAWSLRARPGLGASVPVAWDELDSVSSGAHWTLRTARERLVTSDPWAGRAARPRRLTSAIEVLTRLGLLRAAT